MAGTHEGYSLGIKANYAQVEEAKKATTALYSVLGDVERRAKNLHMGATLPREINHIDTVTASYIRRLESEGKTYEANKQKVNAYQGAIGELSKKQNELKSALDQAKEATGRNSDAYRTQRIKINENVAEINRYKAGLKSANEQMHQANPNFWDKVKSHLHATNTEAEKTHRTFKEVFAGSFLGNAVSNGLSNIGSGLKSAYEEGMNLNLAVAKINGRFKGMGMSTRQTQSLDKQLSNLKANTTMTGDNVADLQSHMLNWSAIGTKGAMQMAKTISGVGDSSKLTGNQIEHVSASLQRVGANGKVTYSSLSRINKAAPTFMAQLAKGAGMSQSKMIALLKTGKVTQKQFQGWMADASKYSNTAFKGFGKTQAGALKQMQVARQKLEQQFTKPIFNAKTSGLQALKNIMTSKTVMSGANQLGKAISNGIGFLDKHKSDLVGITKNVISFGVAIGKATWKDFAAIIQNIGKSLGIIHGNGKKSGSALHTLKLATDGLAKNKTAVQWVAKAIIAMAAVKGLKAVTNPLVDLGTKGVHTFQVVRGISRGLRGITDAKKIENMGKLETHFFNIGKGARSAAKGIKKATGWLGKKLFSGDKSLLSKATTLGGKIGNSITKAVVASTKFSMGKRLAVGALAGAAVATPEVINAVKDRHSADKRSQDIGGAVGAVAGGALTSMIPVVGPMLAPVGALIGKYAGRWGGQAVNKFTKGWQAKKPPKKFWSLENLGWSTHDTLNKIGKWGGQVGKKFGTAISKGKGFIKKNGKELALTAVMPLLGVPALLYKNNPKFRKAANSVFNHVKAGWKGAKTWASKLGRDTSRNIKNGWNGMRTWASKRLKDVQSGWKGAVSWFGDISSKSNKWFKSKWRGIRSWSKGIYKGFQSGWNGLKNWLGDLAKGAVDLFKKPFEGLSSWVNQHIPKPIRDVAGKIGNGAKSLWSKVTGKAHAKGGLMLNNHSALVGEAGPELAYKPYASHVRLLGANGPEFTKVHSGEHILNAHDTARVMGGGLGHGMVLNGYANGTEKLGKTKKTVTDDYKQIADKSSKSLNKLSKKSKNAWSTITRSTGKETSKTQKIAIAHYSGMRTGVNKQMDKMLNSAHKQMGQMRTGVNKQMGKMHDGVISLSESTAKGFGKALDKTKGFARSAMKNTIGVINNGISGIDKVLGQFGGNTSVIKPVKFATGTDPNGRLTQNTYAMVNDATNGPRQEALVSDKNEVFMPRGHNVEMMIPKGWGVLNGTQTLQTGLQHFSKGSGLSHSVLRKLAEKAGANPVQSFKDMFLSYLKPGKTNFGRGSTNLASNSGKHFGDPWSAAMWSVINNAIGNSSKNANGLLKAVEKSGESHRYVWGAAGPSTFDCSGLIMYALKHDYGISYPHFSGAQYARTRHISKNQARMGDLVFWGAGGGDHVGVYDGGNQYFSAESPSQGIHMNTLNSVVGKGSPMFGRIKGIVAPSTKHKDKVDSRLIRLAKHELGFSALKWIKDNLGDYGSLANPSGDGVARWRKVIERAASAMHVSLSKADLAHILNVTAHESGGDARSVNRWDSNAKAGIPSKGVVQFIQPTFDHYAVKGHHNILNGYDQYLAMFNDKTWRRDLTLGGWGPSGPVRGYAKGGKPKAHTPFIAGERGPELITADGPVKVDTHEQTKHKLSDLVNIVRSPKINRPTHTSKQAPIININFNGPIGGSIKDAKRIADIVKREITKYLVNIGDEFGTDPSLY